MRHIIAPITVVSALLLLPACQDEPTAREQAAEGPTAVPQDEALYDAEPGDPATSPATNKVDEVQNEVAEDMMDEDAAPPQDAQAGETATGSPTAEGSAASPQVGTQAAPSQQKPAAEAPAVEQPAAQPQGETQAQAPAAPAVEAGAADAGAAQPEPAPQAAPAAPAGASAELVAQGKQLWAKNCKGCHGADGSRTQMGKRTMADMSSDAWQQQATAAGIAKVIREGGNGMPGYGSRLSDPEIEALVAYTQSL